MPALILLALLLLAASVWWLSRPLRKAPGPAASSERAELEALRSRLLVQLNELDAERADHGIEENTARDEESRLSAELAAVLKRIEALPPEAGAAPLPLPARTRVLATTGMLLLLAAAAGGLYLWQNAANLQGFWLAARSGSDSQRMPPMVFEMVARLEQRLAEQPDDAQAWARLGRSYQVLQQPDKARDAYAKAYALAPDNVSILSDYAWMVFNENPGETTGLALTLYTRLGRLDPEHADALWFLGLAAYQKGDLRGALRTWERLAKKLPAGSAELAELHRAMQVARNQVAGKKPHP